MDSEDSHQDNNGDSTNERNPIRTFQFVHRGPFVSNIGLNSFEIGAQREQIV